MNNLNFKLTSNPVIQDNPEFESVPEFARLTERQLRYVMLLEWYGSPLRLMKHEDRKLKAALMAGYRMELDGNRPDNNTRNLINGKVANVIAALKVMKEIQHDNEMELKEALDTQINEVIQFFKRPDKSAQELDKAVLLMTKLPAILETKRKILELLNFREVEVVNTEDLKGDGIEKSFLDEFNENETN